MDVMLLRFDKIRYKIDGLVQERRNSIANVFLALTQPDVLWDTEAPWPLSSGTWVGLQRPALQWTTNEPPNDWASNIGDTRLPILKIKAPCNASDTLVVKILRQSDPNRHESLSVRLQQLWTVC